MFLPFRRYYVSSPLLAMTMDWHSQCLQKQLGVLGSPIGIILDNGQAIASDDLPNRHLVSLHRIHHKKEIPQFIWRFI